MQARAEYDSIYKPTNKTMAACLLVNDDTIKLTEWIAYHYTVLPLSHLIVAIDPNSLLEDKIHAVLDLWKDRLQHLEVWTNDTWMTLNATQGGDNPFTWIPMPRKRDTIDGFSILKPSWDSFIVTIDVNNTLPFNVCVE